MGPRMTTNWETGRPSNESENCMAIEPEAPNTGKWVDEPCSKKNQVVCQNGQQWSLEHIQQSIIDLRQHTVPIGFIYVQLPNQPEPTVLCPKMYWSNVTPSYAGLFFRAEGGASEKFNGNVQEGDSPRLISVDVHDKNINETSRWVPVTPGVYTRDLFSGHACSPSCTSVFQNFLVSLAEVRPRNQAIRIWKRIQ